MRQEGRDGSVPARLGERGCPCRLVEQGSARPPAPGERRMDAPEEALMTITSCTVRPVARTTARSAAAVMTAIFVAGLPVSAAAQAVGARPALDHDDTYRWRALRTPRISADGRWAAWVVEPWDGDPELVVSKTDGSASLRVRGRGPVFTRDSRHLAYRVPPPQAEVDALTRDGKSGDELPGDFVGVLSLAAVEASPDGAGAEFTAGPVESFQVPEDGGAWIAYRLSEDPAEAGDAGAETEGEETGAAGAEEEAGSGAAAGAEEEAPPRSPEYEKRHEKEAGTPLVLRRLDTGEAFTFPDAAAYQVADSGTALAYAASTDEAGGDGVHWVDAATGTATAVMEGEGHYRQLAFDASGGRLAFVSDAAEWEREQPAFSLYRSDAGAAAVLAAGPETAGMPAGWRVSEHGDVSFSDDGVRLFFGTAPRPDPEPDEPPLERDEVRLDVWNWKDPYLQPMQLVQLDDERERSYPAVVLPDGGGAVQLGSPDLPDVARTEDGGSDFVLGGTDVPYRQELSWDARYRDVYAMDVRTGERRRLAARVRGGRGAGLSPGGAYAYWWDDGDRDWKAAPVDGSTGAVSLTADIPRAFHDELNDRPQGPSPYAAAQWIEGDAGVIVHDRYDAWRVDPAARQPPVRLTSGRAGRVRHRLVRTDDDPALAEGVLLFSTFDERTRAGGHARGRSDGADGVTALVSGPFRFRFRAAAEDAGRLLWTRESFGTFGDLWTSDADFGGRRKLSDVNPQQADYRWGTAELVDWTSNDGARLEGLLVTPEGFDPSRRYPLMVYFYERMSDGLHDYRAPTPGSSSIAFSFYASRGYVVFAPDIPYEVGYPGESALDAVVPGVLELVRRGFVDPARIGVQGHSWGGYQIAYMVTRTNLFAAAEAGAPVANMTSAYGGIRWQSGMSRMFQYERTQSRIGGTLWDERDLYVHNSPLFFADKVRTPLLMMHNDDDGAVPWYQGIELFVALRRLQKPVFLLNYNGEAHGLRRRAHQEDWAVRMQQFFDHYLLDAPAPRWMAEGVPAVDKGRDLGLAVAASPAAEPE